MAKRRSKGQPKRAAPRRGGRRASWKGNLTFGLVSFEVEAFNAIEREGSDVHFHQLHAKCHRRIHYEKVCPVQGEVPTDEIVSGYEVKAGKYVEVTPEELNAARTKSERALKIDAFVSPGTVDPLYFEGRMYYLVPSGKAAEQPYGVLVSAMEHEEWYAVGQVAFSGKDQIVLVRVLDGVLHMAMLNYPAEIRPAGSVAKGLKRPRGVARQVKLAQTLVRGWSDADFDFGQYEDSFRNRIKKLIAAKRKGQDVSVAPEEEEPPEVVNFMEALKESINQQNRPSRKRSKRTA